MNKHYFVPNPQKIWSSKMSLRRNLFRKNIFMMKYQHMSSLDIILIWLIIKAFWSLGSTGNGVLLLRPLWWWQCIKQNILFSSWCANNFTIIHEQTINHYIGMIDHWSKSHNYVIPIHSVVKWRNRPSRFQIGSAMYASERNSIHLYWLPVHPEWHGCLVFYCRIS